MPRCHPTMPPASPSWPGIDDSLLRASPARSSYSAGEATSPGKKRPPNEISDDATLPLIQDSPSNAKGDGEPHGSASPFQNVAVTLPGNKRAKTALSQPVGPLRKDVEQTAPVINLRSKMDHDRGGINSGAGHNTHVDVRLARAYRFVLPGLKSLSHGSLTNDEAICRLLSRLQSNHVGVLDSLCLGSSRQHPEPLRSFSELAAKPILLIPVHKSNHWFLVCWRQATRRLEVFDSLDSGRWADMNATIRNLEPVVSFLRWMHGSHREHRSIVDPEQPPVVHRVVQQTNGWDCGVHLLHTAYDFCQNHAAHLRSGGSSEDFAYHGNDGNREGTSHRQGLRLSSSPNTPFDGPQVRAEFQARLLTSDTSIPAPCFPPSLDGGRA